MRKNTGFEWPLSQSDTHHFYWLQVVTWHQTKTVRWKKSEVRWGNNCLLNFSFVRSGLWTLFFSFFSFFLILKVPTNTFSFLLSLFTPHPLLVPFALLPNPLYILNKATLLSTLRRLIILTLFIFSVVFLPNFTLSLCVIFTTFDFLV